MTMDRRRAHAFDRAAVRSEDADGRLHVTMTPISKAAINPYLGREIPNWQELGLHPDRVYRLFRDPAELKRAAATFNNLPLLLTHAPVTAEDHRPELVVGSTGTDGIFSPPFLQNSMVIWSRLAIDAVTSGARRQLSCGYRYRPDMTPGTADGQAYDGVMRDIVGNHIALVAEGRAGPDVIVADSAPDPGIGCRFPSILLISRA